MRKSATTYNACSRFILLIVSVMIFPFWSVAQMRGGGVSSKNADVIASIIISTEKENAIQRAELFLAEKPVTVTAHFSPRSVGGKHDFYSEATYWWPDPANPNGPYIRKDGMNNPDNFDFHRQSISRFAWIVGAETSAFRLTKNKKYAEAAIRHLKAWFLDTTTMMNPHFLYAQAIKGVNTGRGIGIIDGIPFIEVTRAVTILQEMNAISTTDYVAIQEWFRSFSNWLNTHQYGIDEMNAKNNHGTWWHAQVAAYARFTGNKALLEKCRTHFREILLPTQMASDGSFPLELERTKPYSYSLFNLDGMATLAIMLTDKRHNEWQYTLPDGRNLDKGVRFMKPYVVDKSKWPYKKDIAYWDDQPGRRPFMFFAAMMIPKSDWISIWKENEERLKTDESQRNMPLKNPILWIGVLQQ